MLAPEVFDRIMKAAARRQRFKCQDVAMEPEEMSVSDKEACDLAVSIRKAETERRAAFDCAESQTQMNPASCRSQGSLKTAGTPDSVAPAYHASFKIPETRPESNEKSSYTPALTGLVKKT